MPRSSIELRADAIRIWQAGLEAVRSPRLMREQVRLDSGKLMIGKDSPETIDLDGVRRITVVGAGKAGAGMAATLEEILGPKLMADKRLTGWLNVPADCVGNQPRIHLHPSRPSKANEPTAEGVAGAEEILRIVSSLGPDDLCLALISGGGTVMLPAPIEGISLADLVAVTRFLSAAGADIRQLNTVRKQLNGITGGGLARACRAGRLATLIISDVLGDPLDLIGSGPTVPDSSAPQQAFDILEQFDALAGGVSPRVFDVLKRKIESAEKPSRIESALSHHVIGNNAAAVKAAGQEAERLGYSTTSFCAQKPEGLVEPIGRHLADMAALLGSAPGAKCFISGGEGTVKLAPEDQRGLGGRNQQTVLAALMRLAEIDPRGVAILSAGTDGEDGPTDAAGAVVDAAIIEQAQRRGLNAADYLRRNDAYHFFEPLDALVKTGLTNTNVCDVRVVVTEGA